jgi:hypothetical protein
VSEVIPFTQSTDFSGLRLELTSNHHVATPWFQFDWKAEGLTGPADYRSRYHQIIQQSIAAFATLLKIDRMDIMVTQKDDPSDPHVGHWWRLSTRRKMELPKPAKPPRPTLPENRDAIDI